MSEKIQYPIGRLSGLVGKVWEVDTDTNRKGDHTHWKRDHREKKHNKANLSIQAKSNNIDLNLDRNSSPHIYMGAK